MMPSTNQLCFCQQPPRVLLHNTAVCRCPHLVYRRTQLFALPSFMPSTIGNTVSGHPPAWQAYIERDLRTKLIADAKRAIGGDLSLDDYENVRLAMEAARLAGETQFADDLEYEQWVMSL